MADVAWLLPLGGRSVAATTRWPQRGCHTKKNLPREETGIGTLESQYFYRNYPGVFRLDERSSLALTRFAARLLRQFIFAMHVPNDIVNSLE